MMENDHKMNVCRSVDGIGRGTGTGCKVDRKMDCRLHLLLYIVQLPTRIWNILNTNENTQKQYRKARLARAPGQQVLLGRLEMRTEAGGLQYCRPPALKGGKIQRIEEAFLLPLHLEWIGNDQFNLTM